MTKTEFADTRQPLPAFPARWGRPPTLGPSEERDRWIKDNVIRDMRDPAILLAKTSVRMANRLRVEYILSRQQD